MRQQSKPTGRGNTASGNKSEAPKRTKAGGNGQFRPGPKPKVAKAHAKPKVVDKHQSASFETQRTENEDYIYGRNSVMEALEAGHEINKLLVLDGQVEGSIRKIIQLAKDKGIVIQQVERQKLNLLTDGGNHQGVLAYISPYDYAELEDIISKDKGKEQSVILLLDEVSDPHNLGSIIRSSEAFGVAGVVIPKRRSAALSATVAKTAVGALEYIPVARVNNLNQAIDTLKDEGYWVVGADMTGVPLGTADLKGKIVIVMGSEGFGIARLTKEKCDRLVKIPMVGKTSSLNVSVAASVILYEASKQQYGL